MIKATIKFILWKHDPNPVGHLPIYLRITIDRKPAYVSTGKYVSPKLWDEKSESVKSGHPLSDVWNTELLSIKNKIHARVVDLSLKGERPTAALLKSEIAATDLHNIFDFVVHFSNEVAHKREGGTLENYRKHLLKLQEFHGSAKLAQDYKEGQRVRVDFGKDATIISFTESGKFMFFKLDDGGNVFDWTVKKNKLIGDAGKAIMFEHVTKDYLTAFEIYLRKSVGNNYIYAIFKTIQTIFIAAKDKGIIDSNPFDDYEMVEYKAPEKDYLSDDELVAWMDFIPELIGPQKKILEILGDNDVNGATLEVIADHLKVEVTDIIPVVDRMVKSRLLKLRETQYKKAQVTRYYRSRDALYTLSSQTQTSVYFLLGCFTGLRVSDWQVFDLDKRLHGKSIRLRATKNGVDVSIPIHARLRTVLDYVRQNPLKIAEQTINDTLKVIAHTLGMKKR